MHQLEPIQSNLNFVVKNHNSAGATQVTDGNRAVFTSETTLDAAIAATHAVKDRPHLTMNDKVFAARYGIATISPYDTKEEE